MIINHNIDSIIASNRINSAGKMKADAMGKISSGIRIKQASDDAAGTVVSQKMKAQMDLRRQKGIFKMEFRLFRRQKQDLVPIEDNSIKKDWVNGIVMMF